MRAILLCLLLVACKTTAHHAPTVGAAKWGVSIMGTGGGSDFRVESPFGPALLVGGNTPLVAFAVAPDTKLTVDGVVVTTTFAITPAIVLAATPPLELYPPLVAHPTATLPVTVTTPDGKSHPETLSVQYESAPLFRRLTRR